MSIDHTSFDHADMIRLHTIITKAVTATVLRSAVTEREAFRRHMNYLLKRHPRSFAAYTKWLETKAA